MAARGSLTWRKCFRVLALLKKVVFDWLEWFSFKKQVMLYQVVIFFLYHFNFAFRYFRRGSCSQFYLFISFSGIPRGKFWTVRYQFISVFNIPHVGLWRSLTFISLSGIPRGRDWPASAATTPPPPPPTQAWSPTSLFLIHISYSWPLPPDPSFLHIE